MSIVQHDYEVRISERAKGIRGSGIRKAFDMAAEMKNLIHLGLGEPDFDAPERLQNLVKEAMDAGFSHYTPNSGMPEFREALAEKLRVENGLEYDPKTQVIATVGGMNAIHLAMLCLVNPGDEVLMQDPAFVGFEPCTIMCGGTPVMVPLKEENDFHITPEDIEARITDKTKVIIINSPHNPTGAVLTPEEMEKIAAICVKYDLFLISDEVYEKLIYDGKKHRSFATFPGMKERTLTVNSFSKSYCICGWRLGFAAGPAVLINNMTKFQQFDSVHPPAPMQKAAITYLKESEPFMEKIRNIYEDRRNFLVERLNKIDEISCVKPGGALYVFMNIKKLGMTSEDFAMFLLKNYGIVVVPGTALGKNGEGFIRICITVGKELLGEAADRIEKAAKQILENKVSNN